MANTKTTPTTPKKSPVAKSKATPKSKFQKMLMESITNQIGTGRNASVSAQSITKYIMSNFEFTQTEKIVKNYIKAAVKKCIEDGTIVHHKGTGFGGSFKFPSKKQIAAKEAEKKANEVDDVSSEEEEPIVKKPKTPIKKKSTTTTKSPAPKKATVKKTPVKTAPKMAASKKSPKKAKKEAPVKK